MVARKLERAAKILEKLEAQVKPGQKVCVWYWQRDNIYKNADGLELEKEEIPGGENVLNIIVSPAGMN